MIGRVRHPTFAELADFQARQAPADVSSTVAAHLATCAECAATVAWLGKTIDLMQTDDSVDAPAFALANVKRLLPRREPTGLRPTLRRLIAALQFDSATAPLALGFRSASVAPRQRLYQADGFDLDVRVEAQAGRWQMIGQILGPSAAGEIELANARDVARAKIDDLGEFTLPPAPNGRYTLTARLDDVEIVVNDFELGEAIDQR